MRFLPVLTAILLTFFIAGCGRHGDDQFFGKWTFDHDYTTAHMPKELLQPPGTTPAASPASKGSPTASPSMANELNTMMNQTLNPMLAQQLLGQLDGQTFSITPKTMTTSSGQTLTYEVVERAAPNSITIKFSDGDVQVFTIEDGRIVMTTTGSVHFKTYYHRVNQ